MERVGGKTTSRRAQRKRRTSVSLLSAFLLCSLLVCVARAGIIRILDEFNLQTSETVTVPGSNPTMHLAGDSSILGIEREAYQSISGGSGTASFNVFNGVARIQKPALIVQTFYLTYDGNAQSTTAVDEFGLGSTNLMIDGSDALSLDVKGTSSFNVTVTAWTSSEFASKTFIVPGGIPRTLIFPFSFFPSFSGSIFEALGALQIRITSPSGPANEISLSKFGTFATEISGKLFCDTNENGRRDISESGFPDQWIEVTNAITNDFVGTVPTSSLGDFRVIVPDAGLFQICALNPGLIPTTFPTQCNNVTVEPQTDKKNVMIGFAPPHISLSVDPPSVTEAEGRFFLSIRRDIMINPLSVFIKITGNATFDQDYYPNPYNGQNLLNNILKIDFYSGNPTEDVYVYVYSDDLIEGNEQIVFTVMPTGFYKPIGDPTLVTIIDSPVLSMSARPPSMTRARNLPYTFELLLSFPLPQDVYIPLIMYSDGSVGVNFTLSIEPDYGNFYTVVIPEGQVSTTFTVQSIQSFTFETDSVYVNFYYDGYGGEAKRKRDEKRRNDDKKSPRLVKRDEYPPYITPSPDYAEIFIVKNDFSVGVRISETSIDESQGGVTVYFDRVGGLYPVDLFFTISGTATPGVDYLGFVGGEGENYDINLTSGTNMFYLPFGYPADFYISTIPDRVFEGPETIIITLNASPYYTVNNALSTATITINGP